MVTTAETLETRRAAWRHLDALQRQIAGAGCRGARGEVLAEFSALYRSACADLAMADQLNLSPESRNYLHDLVGRTHNTLYRSQQFELHTWVDILFRKSPRLIFTDRCVHLCCVIFFGIMSISAFAAYNESMFPGFAQNVLGSKNIEQVEEMYTAVDFDRGLDTNLSMVAFYIYNNTGIGMQCFGTGILILPGLVMVAYNACVMGATFGYMARPGAAGSENFLEFVTAHGAFELTAIVLAAAGGLRIGTGWLFTSGLSRIESLKKQALRALPVLFASVILFFLAAVTEGMISPSSLPYIVKVMWGMGASFSLMFYFVVLGYPSGDANAAG